MHELTKEVMEHINDNYRVAVNYGLLDKIITSWLREKAEELADDDRPFVQLFKKKRVMEILGLEQKECEHIWEYGHPTLSVIPVKERKDRQCIKCHVYERNKFRESKEPKMGRECEHRLFWCKTDIGEDWKFCPVCGKPRPTPRAGLAEKLKDTWFKNTPESDKTLYEALAQAAIQHFLEIVDEQKKLHPESAYDLIDRQELKDRLREL